MHPRENAVPRAGRKRLSQALVACRPSPRPREKPRVLGTPTLPARPLCPEPGSTLRRPEDPPGDGGRVPTAQAFGEVFLKSFPILLSFFFSPHIQYSWLLRGRKCGEVGEVWRKGENWQRESWWISPLISRGAQTKA